MPWCIYLGVNCITNLTSNIYMAITLYKGCNPLSCTNLFNLSESFSVTLCIVSDRLNKFALKLMDYMLYIMP